MELENVSVERTGKGETKEHTTSLTENLVLPHDMRELVEKFAAFEKPATPPPATMVPPAIT